MLNTPCENYTIKRLYLSSKSLGAVFVRSVFGETFETANVHWTLENHLRLSAY